MESEENKVETKTIKTVGFVSQVDVTLYLYKPIRVVVNSSDIWCMSFFSPDEDRARKMYRRLKDGLKIEDLIPIMGFTQH